MSSASFHPHIPHFVPVRRHNQPVIVHVTICVAGKLPLLASDQAHRSLVEAWRRADRWRVGEYVVMPEHVHMFCSPGTGEGYPLRRWVGYWKRVAGELDGTLRGRFQEDCWDTQMRTLAHYDEKLSYIRLNLVRRGLVADWLTWPYRGQLNQLVWM